MNIEQIICPKCGSDETASHVKQDRHRCYDCKHKWSLCSLCRKPMPEGEEMFNYHGYSGPCPDEGSKREPK